MPALTKGARFHQRGASLEYHSKHFFFLRSKWLPAHVVLLGVAHLLLWVAGRHAFPDINPHPGRKARQAADLGNLYIPTPQPYTSHHFPATTVAEH